jgi:hypothetical protein
MLPTMQIYKFEHRPSPLAAIEAVELARAELHSLPELVATHEFSVRLAHGDEAPYLLRALGRARELTFRAVGEGTGTPVDLDAFDTYYDHLVLWHKDTDSLAGAYRVGHVEAIVAQHGVSGLYTHQLFHYDAEFFPRTGPALELGRSFISARYQRHYGSLLCLWKGLGRYIARYPAAPALLGAVSISNSYSPISRALIADYFTRQSCADRLNSYVAPRTPLPAYPLKQEPADLTAAVGSVETLSAAISSLEADGKGLPVLLRQYLKLGGRLLAFNVDSAFSDALDGLIYVDLRHTDPRILERVMGSAGLMRFAAFHKTAQTNILPRPTCPQP